MYSGISSRSWAAAQTCPRDIDPGNSHSRASAPCDFRRSACLLPPLAGQASVPPDCHSLLPQFGESEPSDSLLRFAAALRNCVFGRSKAPPLQISCFKLCKYRSFPATPKHSGELCSPACTGNRAWLLPLPNTSPAFGRGMGFQREIGGNPNSPFSLWAQRSAFPSAAGNSMDTQKLLGSS